MAKLNWNRISGRRVLLFLAGIIPGNFLPMPPVPNPPNTPPSGPVDPIQPVQSSLTYDEVINNWLTSPPVNAINFLASVDALVSLLLSIEKRWSKKHSADSTSSQKNRSDSLGTEETNIVTIRLRMIRGNEPEFEERLREPTQLKDYIDVFNHPSSHVKLLQVRIELKHGGPITVIVSEETPKDLLVEVESGYILLPDILMHDSGS
jgi:hypothetical protein